MPSLSDILRARGFEPHPLSRAAKAIGENGVSMTAELARILALPRRPSEPSADLPDDFALPEQNCPGCSVCHGRGAVTLRPFQRMMLDEARKADGLFASVGVGEGKTLVTLLLPEVLKSKKAVLLIKPSLLPQFLDDVEMYSRHFRISCMDRLHVVSYNALSTASTANILEEICPDLVVADEAHLLRHKDAARTKRFLRFMKGHPETRFCPLSGSMVTDSLFDFAHLIELALRKNSPLPNKWTDLRDWAAAIDDAVVGAPMAPGKLLLFCQEGESVRSGFRRRLVESPGVVATSEASIGTSLILEGRRPEIPERVKAALVELERLWSWNGEEFEDALALSRVARQLACGFYYRWVWPDGEPDREWLAARAAWHKEVRDYLHRRSRPGMDSPLLLANAARAGSWASETWEAWAAVKDRPEPPVEAVWLDDFILDDVEAWAKDGGIVWYEHATIGERLEKRGFRVFGAGPEAAKALSKITAGGAIVCSIKAHKEGRNLQMFSRNLVTTPPAKSKEWEQIIGRSHRPGQRADEVQVDVYVHTKEYQAAVEHALKNAVYVEETQGQKQRLLYASRIGI